MTELSERLLTAADASMLVAVGRATFILVLTWLLARLMRRLVTRITAPRMSAQKTMLIRRIAVYLVMVLGGIWFLRELGFDLGVLIGAAGILTVAVGFASQTSVSNIISGVFLIGEQPFEVGDVITVDGTTGEVLSVDLLSVKLRTFDNLMVRMPNETMLKVKVTNLTRFPIRRHDMKIGVAYKEDLGKVHDVLSEVADKNPICLEEPAPLILFLGYGESSLDIQFSVWATRANYIPLRNSIYREVKEAFDAAGIEIPFPHRSLYAGSVSAPFPVRLVDAKVSSLASNPSDRAD